MLQRMGYVLYKLYHIANIFCGRKISPKIVLVYCMNFNFRQYGKGCHIHYVIVNTQEKKSQHKITHCMVVHFHTSYCRVVSTIMQLMD